MFIIWGSKLYGKVDVVPGLFHVETKFGHLYYFPLIPVESYIIMSKSGDGFQGIRIPMSFKSVMSAWLRAFLLIAGLVATIMALTRTKDDSTDWVVPLIAGVMSLALFAVLTFTRGATHASYDRAHHLGELVGLTPQGRQIIDQIYGQGGAASSDPFARP